PPPVPSTTLFRSFSGHMVQHLLITLIFPLLWIRGIPPWMWDPLVGLPGVAPLGRRIAHPIVAFCIGTGVLYLWHIPVMYEWAMIDHDVHVVEHLMFMVSA